MATPAAVLSIIVEANTGKAEAALKEFQRNLSKADREKAEAELAFQVEKGGYNVFSGLVKKADAMSAEAKLGFDVDKSSLAQAKAAQAVLTKESSRLGDVFDRSQLSIGQWTGILAASIPVVFDLAGALGALTASLGAAATGLAVLGVGGIGAGVVGIAGIASVAVPAIASLKDLKTAQDAYTEAVDRYGKQSSQAETAFTKLAFEQKRAGPLATALADNLATLTRRWKALTKAGQTDFIGLLNDGVTRLNRKLPMLAESANRSVKALRVGFDAFLDRATGPEFNHFIEVMTQTFARSMKPISEAFGNIVLVLERLAVAVAPDIVRMVEGFREMTQGWVDSTRNAGKLRDVVHGLVNQANTWWKLIKATAGLIAAVLVPGMGQGKQAVQEMTGQLKEWTNWVNPKEMREFFKEGLETTKQLVGVLLSFLPTLVEISKAMRPIARAFLAIIKGLNSLKIGSVSALTVLLGALVGGKMVKGAAGMVSAFTRLKTAILGTAAAERVLGASTAATTAAMETQAVASTSTAAGAFPFAGMGGVPIKKAPSTAQGAFPFAGMGKSFQGAEGAAKWSAQLGKLAKVAGPAALAITAVAGAFMALRDNFLGVRDVFTGFFDKVLKPIGDAFTDMVNELSGGHAAEIFGAIGDALGTIAKPLQWVLTNMTKLVGLLAIGAVAAPFILALTAIAAPIWLAIKATTLFVKALKGFVGFIREGAWGKVGHLLGAPFRLAWDVAEKVLGFIRDKLRDVIDWIKNNWIGSKLDLAAPFRAMWNVVRKVFGFVTDKVRDVIGFIKDHWGSIEHVLTAPFRALKGVVKSVFDWIKSKIEGLLGAVEGVIDKVKSVTDRIPSLGGGPQPSGPQLSPNTQEGIDRWLRRHPRQAERFGGQFGGLVTAQGIVPQGFQAGGMVGQKGLGPGPRDKIPALLEVGELVIPKAMVDKTRKNAKLTAAVMTGELGKGHKEASKDTDKFVKNHGKAWDKLKAMTAKTTERFRKTTVDDFQKTSKQGTEATSKMRERVTEGFGKMRGNAVEQSGKMKSGVSGDFRQLTGTVGDGLRKIGQMTNNALKAFGVKKVDFHIGVGKQRGGHINAPGAPAIGDHIPAMLEKGEFVVNQKATAKHRNTLEKINRDPQRFQTGGVVDRTGVQHFAKGGMAAMLAEANKFEQRHFPYAWGGGHGGFGIQPVDCSGAVSDILHAAGLLKAPMVSGALMNWGKPGKGPLTVYANPEHTFMSLAGRFFGTSSSNPGGGAGWIEGGFDRGYLSGFAARTMDVAGAAAAKVKQVLLKGPDGPLKDMGQAALDKTRKAANKFIDSKMGGAFGGGQTLADFSKGPGKIVGASVYGFGEPGTGTVGASGVSLPGKPAFAELGMGTALGHLPFGKKIGIEVGGRKAVGTKLDIGLGGGTVGGHSRAIDFWRDLAEQLGLSGSFLGLAKVRGLQKGGTVPFVGSYDKGGTVAQTGLGMLHKGEEVIPTPGLNRLMRLLERQLHPHQGEHQRQRERNRRDAAEARQEFRHRRLQRETPEETRHRRHAADEREREQERRRERQAHRENLKAFIEQFKELTKNIEKHNRDYMKLRRNERSVINDLLDLGNRGIGDSYAQKNRLASAGSVVRY